MYLSIQFDPTAQSCCSFGEWHQYSTAGADDHVNSDVLCQNTPCFLSTCLKQCSEELMTTLTSSFNSNFPQSVTVTLPVKFGVLGICSTSAVHLDLFAFVASAGASSIPSTTILPLLLVGQWFLKWCLQLVLPKYRAEVMGLSKVSTLVDTFLSNSPLCQSLPPSCMASKRVRVYV